MIGMDLILPQLNLSLTLLIRHIIGIVSWSTVLKLMNPLSVVERAILVRIFDAHNIEHLEYVIRYPDLELAVVTLDKAVEGLQFPTISASAQARKYATHLVAKSSPYCECQ